MTEHEIWSTLTDGHTGIFTTLRRDGMPIAMPMWYVVVDRCVYMQTRGKKLQRLRNDDRASFLVETGLRWAELVAVHLTGRCEQLDEPGEELTRRFNEEMETRQARSTPQGLLMIDIDHFKQINDALGHQAGDEVLRAVAGRLQKIIRAEDAIFRYGGEEFAVLLDEARGGALGRVAERLRAAVSGAPVPTRGGQRVQVTVSVGATMIAQEEPWPEALERADQALYRSKNEGRDRVTLD